MKIRITKKEAEEWKQEKLKQAYSELKECFSNLGKKEIERVVNGEPFELSIDLSVDVSADNPALKTSQQKFPCERESTLRRLLKGWLRK